MAQMSFHANQVEGDVQDFAPIPKGKYNAVIIKTELGKPNDKKTEQLKLEWEIVDGPFAKRHVSTYVTVCCPTSKEAQDIGMRFLKNVCESVGLPGFTDSDELCGRPHIVNIEDGKPNRDGKVFSEVKRCYPAGAAQAAQQGAPKQAPPVTHAQSPGAAPAATQGAPAGAPPWMRK